MKIRAFLSLFVSLTLFSFYASADPAIPAASEAKENIETTKVVPTTKETPPKEMETEESTPLSECEAELAEMPEDYRDVDFQIIKDWNDVKGYGEHFDVIHYYHLPLVYNFYRRIKKFQCKPKEYVDTYYSDLEKNLYYGSFENVVIPDGMYDCNKPGYRAYKCAVGNGNFTKLGGSQRMHGKFFPSIEGYQVLVGVYDIPSGNVERPKEYSNLRDMPGTFNVNGGHGTDSFYVAARGADGHYYLVYFNNWGEDTTLKLVPERR